MKVRLFAILAILALSIGACNSTSNVGETYVFGVVAPFTGQEGAPVYGKNIRNAVEMRVGELNAAGGARGRRMVPRYEDDQLQAPVAVGAVQKLIGSVLKVFGSFRR